MTNILSSRYLIRKGLMDFMRRTLRGKTYGLVVDIGAGRAPYRNLIACEKYVGVDVRRRGDVENLVIADVHNHLPFADDSVDLVIMTEALEHLRDPAVAMREVWRILKPAGRLILTTPFLWPIHEEPNDYQRFTPYGLPRLLARAGFRESTVSRYGNYALSALILGMFPLRKKIFMPLVFLLNGVGLLCARIPFGSSVFFISQYVTAVK